MSKKKQNKAKKAAAKQAKAEAVVDEKKPTPKIVIHIDQDVFHKIMHWVRKSSNEVSGFGNVVFDPVNKIFRIVDAFLVEQYNNTGTTTELEATDMGRMMFKHRNFGAGAMKWWWHSHVNMNVFWSGTDESTIRQYGGNGFIVATVFNKREEMRSAVCYKSEHPLFGEQLSFVDNVDTMVEYPEAWDLEYDEKVKTRAVTHYASTQTYNQNWLPDYSGRGSGKNRTADDFRANNSLNTSEVKSQTNVEETRASEDNNDAEILTLVTKDMFHGDLNFWQSGKVHLKGIGFVWKHELEKLKRELPKKKENASQPTMFSDKPKSNTFVNGLLGDYGMAAEAAALKMSLDKYTERLALGDDKELDEYQDQLTTLEQAGYFDKTAELSNESGTIENDDYEGTGV